MPGRWSSVSVPPAARLRWRWRGLAGASILATVAAISVPLVTSRAVPAGGWTIVTAPSTGDGGADILLGTTCANAQVCWAVGADLANLGGASTTTASPVIAAWDGSSWSLESPPAAADGGLFGVTCVDVSDCWAVGTLLAAGNPAAPLTEHWDGSAWSVVPAPGMPGAAGAILHGVSCVSASDCWAVGATTDSSGGAVGTILLNWDGTAWSLGTPGVTGQPYEQLNSVTCLDADDCWAVGAAGPQQEQANFLPILPGAVGDQGLIEHFDGSGWSVVGSPASPPPGGGWLSAVTCLQGDECWAVGATTDASGGPSGDLVERWNGATWSTVPAPAAPTSGAILLDVACTGPAQCWASGAVGPFGVGGGSLQTAPEIVAWNGSGWSVQPSPNVTALALLAAVTCQRGVGCWSAGTSVTEISGSAPQFSSLLEQLLLPPASSQGFVAAAADGGIFSFGNARFYGSMGGTRLIRPVVGTATSPDDNGYWEVAADGGVFSFGDAAFHGSMGGLALNRPVVGMAATPDGKGYWEVAADGGIFSFGDAPFYGSMGGTRLDQPIVGMAASPDGKGYWEVAADGGIFAFGSAKFRGSLGGIALRRPVVGMAATPNGTGYWLVAADGGIFGFGNATYLGSAPGQGIVVGPPVVGMAAAPDGDGYWLLGADGSTFAYGDAAFFGSLVGVSLAAPMVGAAA